MQEVINLGVRKLLVSIDIFNVNGINSVNNSETVLGCNTKWNPVAFEAVPFSVFD